MTFSFLSPCTHYADKGRRKNVHWAFDFTAQCFINPNESFIHIHPISSDSKKKKRKKILLSLYWICHLPIGGTVNQCQTNFTAGYSMNQSNTTPFTEDGTVNKNKKNPIKGKYTVWTDSPIEIYQNGFSYIVANTMSVIGNFTQFFLFSVEQQMFLLKLHLKIFSDFHVLILHP